MDDCISSLDIIRGARYYTEETILPNERTDLVSTNKLGHGWAYQKLANQQAIFLAGCKDGCDWLPD